MSTMSYLFESNQEIVCGAVHPDYERALICQREEGHDAAHEAYEAGGVIQWDWTGFWEAQVDPRASRLGVER